MKNSFYCDLFAVNEIRLLRNFKIEFFKFQCEFWFARKFKKGLKETFFSFKLNSEETVLFSAILFIYLINQIFITKKPEFTQFVKNAIIALPVETKKFYTKKFTASFQLQPKTKISNNFQAVTI